MVVKRHLALDALIREILAGVLLAVLDLALAAHRPAIAHPEHWLRARVKKTLLYAVSAVVAEEIFRGALRFAVAALFVVFGLFNDD